MRQGSDEREWREDCAPRRVLDIFSTKWTSMILHTLDALHDGEARTGVLQRSLPGISKKMLVQTLREMEASGLIERHVESAVPPAVRYSLTPLGHRFVGLIDLVYDWGRMNADALDALQSRDRSRKDAQPKSAPTGA
ncbi:helix-turn-helix domain-containing protein [Palleronia sp. LCG004]|uniref:winged helix-turn-helix transcriptional regulator n=1 Tax=Palleronia sp. LCG004 TaxID=3079304 RepID=UPI002942A91E|nr:helix-turn-helix domain-containing protein [Palleronia sp. LCG004]WOI58193.1 helix-turn-helix domain-containing protein [Palleronia sp. LCG004]